MFSSYSFTVDTSPHRSTSTGTTFVIKRTRQFTSTPKTTTPLHTQASIPSNTQPSIFSQSREHSPNTVTTRSTVHASFPLSTQTRTHTSITLTTRGRAHVFTSLITQLRTPTTTPLTSHDRLPTTIPLRTQARTHNITTLTTQNRLHTTTPLTTQASDQISTSGDTIPSNNQSKYVYFF